MALYLTNDDVRMLITTQECVEVMEDLFLQESRGLVENMPRQRIRFPKASANIMGGTVLGSNAYGVRHSNVTLLYDTETGKLDAVIAPGELAWIRTGAATGLAVRHMSKPDAAIVGLIGTGRQAITQLEGVCAVRAVKHVKVYGRNEEKRRGFAAEMRERLGVDVVPVDSSEACVRGSDVVVTITSSREPVFDGTHLNAGAMVAAAGVNSWVKREVDDTTIQRAALIAVDNIEQAKLECGELIWAAERGMFNWRQAVPLSDVVSGKVAGRPSTDAITLFESQGIGIEDIAASKYVLAKARAAGVGVELPF